MVGLHFGQLQRDLRERGHPEDEDVQQPLARQRGSGVRGECHGGGGVFTAGLWQVSQNLLNNQVVLASRALIIIISMWIYHVAFNGAREM